MKNIAILFGAKSQGSYFQYLCSFSTFWFHLCLFVCLSIRLLVALSLFLDPLIPDAAESVELRSIYHCATN